MKKEKQMTMAMAWVRTMKNSSELIFASDSRLRDAGHFDCGHKILPLPRGDCAICFSGNTAYAYPILNHVYHMCNMNFKVKTRAKCLSDFKKSIFDMFNNMTSLIGDLPSGNVKNIDSNFIFGGYCWQSEEFKFWRFHFNVKLKKFILKKANAWNDQGGKKKLLFIGDYQEEAMIRLDEKLKEKGKTDKDGFDYEPFEVLRDMLRENENYPYIGGAPQIVKIYKSMNCLAFPIYWPNKDANKLYYMGRPLLDYERHTYLNFDPDTFDLEMPNNSKE